MKTAASLRRNVRGNVATVSALLAVPLVFAVGAGIDMSRLHAARLGLQNAVDAAALAVVKDSAFQAAEAERIARRMIQTNHGPAFDALTVAFSEFGATVTARTEVEMTLSKVLGFTDLSATVSSTAEYPPTRYEIALVLDTTGSMEGIKLAEMKKAARGFVEELTRSEIMRRRVSFALVPFSTYVNVGGDKASADWIDSAGLVQLPYSVVPTGVSRLEIFRNFGQTWKGCVETRLEGRGQSNAVDDARPTKADPLTLYVPALAPDEPASSGYRRSYPNDYTQDGLSGLGVDLDGNGRASYRRGLAVGRPYRFFSNDTTPQGPNWGCDSQPVRALTKNYDTLLRDIDALRAAGSTNITEGVAWGNRVLSPGEPFAEGLPYEADVRKIMVVLTDGDNTMTGLDNPLQSTYSSMGYLVDGRWNDAYKNDDRQSLCLSLLGTTLLGRGVGANGALALSCRDRPTPGPAPSGAEVTAAMNRRTLAACGIAKTAGVEVYTVRLEVDTSTSSALLGDCATSQTHYYDVPDAGRLQEIFDDIAGRVMTLKITS